MSRFDEMIAALKAEGLDIVALLDEMVEDLAHWGGYASDYFKDKWGLSLDIARYTEARDLARALAQAPADRKGGQ